LQGKTAQQLISTAVAGSLGTLMMDNYALNRWLDNKNDDPIFSGGDFFALDHLTGPRLPVRSATFDHAGARSCPNGRLHDRHQRQIPLSSVLTP
jgi:hypothetical protein